MILYLEVKVMENSKRFNRSIKGKEKIGPLKNQYACMCVEPQGMGDIFSEYCEDH